jgi:30S ribosomal protein S31
MGRGDKRSAKGKRFKGSYGNSRPHREPTAVPASAAATGKKEKAPKKEKEAKAEKPVKKAAAKKAPKKKEE